MAGIDDPVDMDIRPIQSQCSGPWFQTDVDFMVRRQSQPCAHAIGTACLFTGDMAAKTAVDGKRIVAKYNIGQLKP
jgi:hypothetical protein